MPLFPDSVATMRKSGSIRQAGSEVVAGAVVVVATTETTVDELKILEELEELEELDELDGMDELDKLEDVGAEIVLLVAGGAMTGTAYNCTCLQDEPRLYSNLGVRTARIPAQSAKRLVSRSFDLGHRTRCYIPDSRVAPRTARANWHCPLIDTV